MACPAYRAVVPACANGASGARAGAGSTRSNLAKAVIVATRETEQVDGPTGRARCAEARNKEERLVVRVCRDEQRAAVGASSGHDRTTRTTRRVASRGSGGRMRRPVRLTSILAWPLPLMSCART